MKKRTLFFGAILSIIPLAQPLIIKTSIALSTSALILTVSDKALANSLFSELKEAMSLRESGDNNKAIVELNNILKKYPNLPSYEKGVIFINLALSYSILEKKFAALEYINKAIDLNTENNQTAYLLRAKIKLDIGDQKGSCLDLRVAGDFGLEDVSKYLELYGCN